MAMLLQYRNGQLIPVKVDSASLMECYEKHEMEQQPLSAYQQIMESSRKKRLYGGLMMMFVVMNATLLMMAARWMA
jgi:hypothetical protein